jgi:hypothetical protein
MQGKGVAAERDSGPLRNRYRVLNAPVATDLRIEQGVKK